MKRSGLSANLGAILTAGLMVAVLSSCATKTPPASERGAPAPGEPERKAVSRQAEPNPEPRKRPATRPETPDQSADSLMAAIPYDRTPEALAEKEEADLSPLIGLAFADVKALFGPADAILDAPPGKTWQYLDGDCGLVVSFYPDLEALSYRVLSYKIETRNKEEGTDKDVRRTCHDRFAKRLRSRS
ncbi:MAG: hypothetical protein D6763_09855 [Alphaproteobacteria bacterium]|nr:MAG: hypothetical protein D6763_09855 [Alphaproteobacteria bacterium]